MLKRNLIVAGLALALAVVSTAEARAQDAPHAAASFTGVWDLKFGSQMGEMSWTLTLDLEEGLLVGVTESEMGAAVVEGTQDGSQVDFTIFIDQPDHAVDLLFTGSVEGDEASGDLDIMGEMFTWSAVKADRK